METAAAVRLVRGYREMSQRALEVASGSGKGYIPRLESGEIKRPRTARLARIAAALDVPLNVLDGPMIREEVIAMISRRDEVRHGIVRDWDGAPENKPVPVISWASAGEGTIYLDQGYGTRSADEWVERPANVKDRRAYAVRIAGDSMVPVLNEGDIVVIDHTKEPIANDLVLVKLKEFEVFVKIYARHGDVIVLKSANSLYDPIVVKESDLAFPVRKVAAILKR